MELDRYRMEDGTIVDTSKASAHWDSAQDHDGRNFIDRATGSQWNHETLYKSRRGRYYIEHTSQYQGSRPHAEWVSEHEAARWLIHNDHKLPEDLAKLADEVTE